MKNLLRRRFLPAILCMALALGLSACGGKDTLPVETETDGAMGTLPAAREKKIPGWVCSPAAGKKQWRRNWRRSP